MNSIPSDTDAKLLLAHSSTDLTRAYYLAVEEPKPQAPTDTEGESGKAGAQ